MAASVTRRTQAERRADTQRRLLDATIEGLRQHGYARMSTNDVVKRAGVSRGALVHHFPTKAQLAVAALDRWLEDRLVEFEATFASMQPEERRADVAIDVLWEMFQGPTEVAWLELTVAARTDPDLWTRLNVVNDRFNEGVLTTFRRTFAIDTVGDIDDGPSDPDLVVRFAFNVLSGAALGQVLTTPPGTSPSAEQPESVAILKFLAQTFVNDPWRTR